MRKIFILLFCFLLVVSITGGCQDTKTTNGNTWQLVWSDEFDYTGFANPEYWSYEKKGARWVNNELQAYRENLENGRAENGKFIIEAHYDEQNDVYTSARIRTLALKDWQYGRFEIRAKLPAGTGTWPAIWMLGYKGSWPACGEIDIMEHVGFDPGKVHASVHTKKYNWPSNTQKTAIIDVDDFDSQFHDYVLEWFPDRLDFYIDGQKFMTYENENEGFSQWPFDNKCYLIINLAIGGNWGGQHGIDNDIFPVRMEIDYVRVYELVK